MVMRKNKAGQCWSGRRIGQLLNPANENGPPTKTATELGMYLGTYDKAVVSLLAASVSYIASQFLNIYLV